MPLLAAGPRVRTEVKKVLEGNTNGNLSISGDGKTLAFTRVSLNFPAEVYAATLGGVPSSVTERGASVSPHSSGAGPSLTAT